MILFSGTIFYRSVEGWSWTDALYFSATTISTVGLGDLSPQTDLGKIFTVVYIFVGVGVFVTIFLQFARALIRVQDGGYAGPKLRDALIRIGRWTIQIVNRSDRAKGFEVLPRR